jgi:eukaryotic-like serine/threonine-protein kinase
MVAPRKIGRYEIRELLGEGGMGVVYRALDTALAREVALKTIRDAPDRTALELFQKEIAVLAPLSHPNLVEIFDIGEYDENGKRRPFFVMPLLPGRTLDHLIRHSSHRLTVDRAVEIFTQTCRGLQAAHERGLVHRDLKPSNIFVLNDYSVKVIDFGVAHMANTRSSRGHRGTLLYMSPEQLEMKRVTAASDIFSVGVVCYEALTQRRPFERATETEVVKAILHQSPALASDLNPNVSTLISRVVHKAMAKQPGHRFATAREFAEILQRAQRNEPIEIFDAARIRPRVERVKKAFEQGDYEFASEILTELEAEGHADPEMAQLRRRTNQAITQRRVRQLLESARTRFDEGEDPLALQKVEEALELDRVNVEALTLKNRIEGRRGDREIESWLSLAHQHIENRAYGQAREALQNALEIRSQEGRALQLLAEVDRDELEYVKLRQEKVRLYEAAQDAWHGGDISTALEEMGRAVALDDRAPDTPSSEHATAYRSFYNQIRLEHDAITNAHAEARRHLADRNFEKVLALCDQYLAKYPNHTLFKALKFDAQAQQRLALSAYIAEIDRRVEAEPDLDKRMSILREALAAYSGEQHFEHSLKLTLERHDLVDSIVARARLYEERSQFTEALGQWEILRTVYERYPGLNFEIERVKKRRDQQSRAHSKARWVEQIDGRLSSGDYVGCLEIVRQAQTEFPNDSELGEVEKVARQGMERRGQAQRLLAQGQEAWTQDRFDEGLELLRRAHEMDKRNPSIRAALLENLAERSRRLVDTDWRAAEGFAQEALLLDPGHPVAKSMRVLVDDLKRQEAIDELVTQVRRCQGAGDLRSALALVERGLASYSREDRLRQLRDTIRDELSRAALGENRQHDLQELRRLGQQAESSAELPATKALCDIGLALARQYPGDREFESLALNFRRRLETISAGASPSGLTKAAARPTVIASAAGVETPGQDACAESQATVVRGVQQAGYASAADVSQPVERRREWRRVFKHAAAALLVASLFAGLVIFLRHHRRQAPTPGPPPTVQVLVNTDPLGANVRIDHQDRGTSPVTARLTQGPHQFDILEQGYQPLSRTVDVRRAAPLPVLALTPLPFKLQVLASDLRGIKVQWDNQPPQEVQDDAWQFESSDFKPHTVEVSSGRARAKVTFDAEQHALPVVSESLPSTRLEVATVASFGGEAHIELGFSAAKIEIDGQSHAWNPEGLDLENLANGNHTLSWDERGTTRRLQFETGPSPELTLLIFLAAPVLVRMPPPSSRPQPPPPPADVSQAQQVYKLENEARDAYMSGRYAEPAGGNAIEYADEAISLSAGGTSEVYGQDLRDRAIQQERNQILTALGSRDFAAARRMVDALASLMPGDAQVRSLQVHVHDTEQEAAVTQSPPSTIEPVWSRPAVFDKRSGMLMVVGHHLRFVSDGQTVLELVCSDITQLKENRWLFHRKGFRVLTRPGKTYEFSSDTTGEDLRSACSK